MNGKVYYSVPHFSFQDSMSLVSPGDGRNDSDVIDHRISLASSHDFGVGIVTSPRGKSVEIGLNLKKKRCCFKLAQIFLPFCLKAL